MSKDNNVIDDHDRKAGDGDAGDRDEVLSILKECGVTADQARDLLRAYGNNRDALISAAKTLATKSHVRSSRV